MSVAALTIGYSQDIASYGVKKGVKVGGGINFSQILYSSNDTLSRRDPYQFIFTANLGINLFGYSAPFTFSYTNSQRNYTQPFNRIKFAPQYKWIKTFIGNTNMVFSPYTLSGHNFLGGGVELTPGKWQISAMAGQLLRPVNYDPLNTSATPSYKRMGYAVKVGVNEKFGSLMLSVFTAKDQTNSITLLPPDGSLRPKQNVAVELSGSTTLYKAITLDVGYAISILDGDTRLSSTAGDLSIQSEGTRRYHAYRLGAGYQHKSYGVVAKYERIDPDYTTLGAYYFNNDLENYTIAPNVLLLKGKLSINANAGLQKNNLDKSKESTTKRWVGSTNVAYTPTEKWMMNLTYSNFSSYTKIKPLADPLFRNDLDTLNFYQLTGNIAGSVSYLLGTKEAPGAISFNSSLQNVKESASSKIRNSGFLSVSGVFSKTLPGPAIVLSVSYNYNRNKAPELFSVFQGPAINVSRLFFEKALRAGFVSTWNQSQTNGQRGPSIFSNTLNAAYTPKGKAKGKPTLSLNVNWLQRMKTNETAYRRELTATLNFSLTLN